MDVDSVVDGLIKNNNLTNLMDEESRLFRQIRVLNSEFHTLLYENYNKLISAAQIIGQMSNKFDHMEQEISSLSENMDEIIRQSDHLSSNLSGKFKNLSKLSSTYSTLRRLQFSSDLNDLVRTCGEKLSKDVIADDAWMSTQKPRHVRPAIIRLVEELATMSDTVALHCDEGSHIEATKQIHFDSARNNPLMTNINKLFSERIEIFGPVAFTRRAILSGIVKIVLKSLIENLRLQTLNKNDFQQIQIDVKYLQHELSRFVSDENIIFALLDEAVTSAWFRCAKEGEDCSAEAVVGSSVEAVS